MADLHRFEGAATIYARLALGTAFLSAVADRFGIWGAPGSRNVAWGDFPHFLTYTTRITPFFPRGSVAVVGLTATVLEVVFGVSLVFGIATRIAAIGAGILLAAFAIGMASGTGVKTAFDASVFSASAGAFLLAFAPRYPLSVDNVLQRK